MQKKINIAILILFLLLNLSVVAQKSVLNLNPKHRQALRVFLDSNQSYSFLSEELYDAEFLKDMRTDRGKNFMPYYMAGDFNHDKVQDFAIILKREGKPEDNNQAEPFRYSYPLALVVFNGKKKGGFQKAFLKNEMMPFVVYLDWTQDKRKRLFYGMDGGLGGSVLTPVSKGYILEEVFD